MLYDTVHSQLIRIGQTDLAHSTLKRHKRCFIISIFVSQHSFLSPKNRFLNPQLYNSPDANKPLNLSTTQASRAFPFQAHCEPTLEDGVVAPQNIFSVESSWEKRTELKSLHTDVISS
jgi:hypothetical protein